jgi:raffinose/stachyose/melibiose transport system substrate-binding protein
MKKSIFLIVLLICSFFISLIGCKKDEKATTLQLFHYKQEIVNQFADIIAAFNEKYPEIKVEAENIKNDSQTLLKTRLVSNQAPDIMMLQSYSTVFEYANSGFLLNLSNESFMNNVVDGSKNAVTYKGEQYALPMDMAGIGVIYNKDIFDKYNLKVPKTFRELEHVCKVLKDNNIIPFAVSIKDNWPLGHFFSMAHTALVQNDVNDFIESMDSGTGTFNTPEMLAMFKVFDFYKENGGPNAMDMDYNNQTTNFASGNYGMMIQGLWAYGNSKSLNEKLNAGFFPFPFTNNPNETKIYADTDSTFAISAKSSPQKIEAAKKFFDFLTSEEGVKIWAEKCKLIPTVKGSDVSSFDEPFQNLVSYINSNDSMPWAFSMWPTRVFEESKKAMQEYYSGQKSAEEVLAYLDSLWRE